MGEQTGRYRTGREPNETHARAQKQGSGGIAYEGREWEKSDRGGSGMSEWVTHWDQAYVGEGGTCNTRR